MSQGDLFGGDLPAALGRAAVVYDHVWRWAARLPERKGQRCRVLVRARRMNSVLVEFEDGYKVVSSRYAVRRLTQ